MVNELFSACSGCVELRSVGSGFNCGLLLGVPIEREGVDKVQYPSDRSACDQVMHEVGINIRDGDHVFSKGFWRIMR